MLNKILAVLALSLIPSATLAAGGGIGTRNVDPTLRTQNYTLGRINITTDSDVTAGTDGVAMIASLSGVTNIVQTTSIAAMPYPAKVQIKLIDGNTDDTLTCTSIVIVGFDQFGNAQRETITSLTETATNTTNVYESISRVTLAGCGTGDSSDNVQLSASLMGIGLPFKVTSANAVLSFCFYDNSGTVEKCYKPCSADSSICFDASGTNNRVDTRDSSIRLTQGSMSVGLGDSDSVVLRVRAPAGAK